jgi:hypothetical protein
MYLDAIVVGSVCLFSIIVGIICAVLSCSLPNFRGELLRASGILIIMSLVFIGIHTGAP